MQRYFDKLFQGSAQQFQQQLAQHLLQQDKLFVVTANPETFMLAQDDASFDALLCRDTTTVVADGIGVVKAARYLGIPVTERVTGVELAQYLLQQAHEHRLSVLLYGASVTVQQALTERLTQRYPNISRLWQFDGYSSNPEEVAQTITTQQPDVVLVALGIPRQEQFLAPLFDKAHKGVYMGVGGALDVLSGIKKRAPRAFQVLNLEWLYRIVNEPKRIKRFVRSNVRFLGKVRRLPKSRNKES